MDIPLKNQTTTCFEPVVLNCPKGKFNDLATLFLVPQEDAIRFNKPKFVNRLVFYSHQALACLWPYLCST